MKRTFNKTLQGNFNKTIQGNTLYSLIERPDFDINYAELFIKAAAAGDIDLMSKLSSSGKITAPQESLPFLIANGRLEALKWLITNTNINIHLIKDIHDHSSIHWAARYGQLDILKWLVNIYKIADNPERTSFILAQQIANDHNHQEAANWIKHNIFYDKEISLHFNNNIFNGIVYYAKSGNLAALKWWSDERAIDLNSFDSQGMHPIHHAAAENQLSVLKWLVNEKKCHYHNTHQGHSVINIAESHGHHELAYWAGMDCKAKQGCTEFGTYIHYAIDCAIKGDLPSIQWLLNEMRISLDDHTVKNLLYYASRYNNINIVNWLVTDMVKFDDDSLIGAIEAAKNGKHYTNCLEFLLKQVDSNGNFKFTINKVITSFSFPEYNGKKLIDLIPSKDALQYKYILDILRRNGAFEPQTTIKHQVEKLIFDSNKSPDLIDGNKERVTALLDFIYKKYPLSDQQVNMEIRNFINKNGDLSQYKAIWSSDINNVLMVIHKLSKMTNIKDRLRNDFNLQKVLATIIHIIKDDEDSIIYLKDTLGQLDKCNLSKLMNLLGVCQHIVIESVNYDQYKLENFNQVLNEIAPLIQNINSSSFAKWFLNAQAQNSLISKWGSDIQKIQAIFNDVFMRQHKLDEQSYHFIEGLKMKVIEPLLAMLRPTSKDSDNTIVLPLQQYIKSGFNILFEQKIISILDSSEDFTQVETLIQQALDSFDPYFCFGELAIPQVKNIINLCNKSYAKFDANCAIKLLSWLNQTFDQDENIKKITQELISNYQETLASKENNINDFSQFDSDIFDIFDNLNSEDNILFSQYPWWVFED